MATKNNPVRIGEIMWQAMPDGQEKYAAYLCSREWALKKEAVKQRSGGMCERCHLYPIENVHHLNYLRKYAEMLTDLAGWCRGCHEFTHAKTDKDPKDEYFQLLKEDRPLAMFLATDMDDGRDTIICPLCKFECCHAREPAFFSGNNLGNAPWNGRGDLIIIPMFCECGHEWEMCFGQHKGNQSAFIRNIRDAEWTKD